MEYINFTKNIQFSDGYLLVPKDEVMLDFFTTFARVVYKTNGEEETLRKVADIIGSATYYDNKWQKFVDELSKPSEYWSLEGEFTELLSEDCAWVNNYERELCFIVVKFKDKYLKFSYTDGSHGCRYVINHETARVVNKVSRVVDFYE